VHITARAIKDVTDRSSSATLFWWN